MLQKYSSLCGYTIMNWKIQESPAASEIPRIPEKYTEKSLLIHSSIK